ncbi:hypothetical protein [Pseudescherichia sp.]|uniref:hypothetical protein n=1 Tax=Pseudescherichia sp. TaxID=2055881 RepID=UPI00289C3BB5|nr:hypothetical protein [Pseudescherichia sp.]
MLERIYFWKGKRGYISPLSATITICIAVFILGSGGFAWWYYGVKAPADKKHELQQLALRKKQSELASIAAFYKKSLTGAGIEQTVGVLGEIRRTTLAMSALGIAIKSENFICDMKSCAFGFKLQPGTILTLPIIDFFGRTYSASIPVSKAKDKSPRNDFEYARLTLPFTESTLLREWKSNKALTLHSCNNIISYVNSYNSLLGTAKKSKALREGIVAFTSYPASPVREAEKHVAGKLKTQGLMSANWEMQINEDNSFFYTRAPEIDAQIALYKQAYRDAFLIRKIEANDKGIKISGGVVCKS